jgi:hypothetical protein
MMMQCVSVTLFEKDRLLSNVRVALEGLQETAKWLFVHICHMKLMYGGGCCL